jgi:hypothetical protein
MARSRYREIYSISVPVAAWPLRRKVLGYLPSPQILNDPKSLTQRPSGASGADSRQSLSLYRSSISILLPCAVEEVVPQRSGKIGPLNFRHLGPEGHSGELVLQTSCFRVVASSAEPLSDVEKFALLRFLRLEATVNEFLVNPSGAHVLPFCKRLDGAVHPLTDGNTTTNLLLSSLRYCHKTSYYT